MPELPEVETARRTAERALKGHRLAEVSVDEDPIVLVGETARRVVTALRGRTVTGSGRHGKYFWLELDQRPWPLFHLGMTGRLYAYREPDQRPPYCKIEFSTDDGRRLAMTNKRRLGRIRLVQDPLHEEPVSRLGFDALLDLPKTRELAALFAARKAPVKALLLDQSLFAGVGNWIADEVLYQARLAPQRRGNELTTAEVGRLRTALKRILARAVDVGADAERFPSTWLFHHRWGKNQAARTARGEAIEFIEVGGRTTAWVPRRQK